MPPSLTTPDKPVARPPSADERVVALDGLRGFMTILVVLSHYFGEVPHGIGAAMVGWIAVDMFFVLSGYLVGKLILEKGGHDNFLQVFFIRRACRTLPIYMLCVTAVFVLLATIDRPWAQDDVTFPLWSYLTFSQNIFMVSTNEVGAHWLGPTWTMGLEEHFYLLLPMLFLLVPRRRLAVTLCAIALAAVALRTLILGYAPSWWMATLVLLPTRADVLLCGVLAALAITAPWLDWTRLDGPLRLATPLLLICAGAAKLLSPDGLDLFKIVGPTLVSLACAAFLLSLVRGAPEAERFRSPVLRFFGETSYAVYLTHVPILGLMHGVLLGAKPDVATAAQWGVTLLALPVTVAAGWALTRLVEAPISAYGRTWKWSGAPRPAAQTKSASSAG